MTAAKPKPKPKDNTSPGYRLVDQVWQHLKTKSWIRTNHTMQDAIDLAVKSCMDFAEADILKINEKMRGGYWLHMESLYSTAVEADNVSACRSIEHALSRRPWILHGRRLSVGAEIDDGFVTSITDDKLIACVYENGQRHGKPVKRHSITREMLCRREQQAPGGLQADHQVHEVPARTAGS